MWIPLWRIFNRCRIFFNVSKLSPCITKKERENTWTVYHWWTYPTWLEVSPHFDIAISLWKLLRQGFLPLLIAPPYLNFGVSDIFHICKQPEGEWLRKCRVEGDTIWNRCQQLLVPIVMAVEIPQGMAKLATRVASVIISLWPAYISKNSTILDWSLYRTWVFCFFSVLFYSLNHIEVSLTSLPFWCTSFIIFL